MQLLALMMLLY